MPAHQKPEPHLSAGGLRQGLQGLQLETNRAPNGGFFTLGQQNNASTTGSGITDRRLPTEQLGNGINRHPKTAHVVINSLASDTAILEEQAGNSGVSTPKKVKQCSTRPSEKLQVYTSIPQAAQRSSITPGTSDRNKCHGSTNEAPQGNISELSSGSVPEAPVSGQPVPPPPHEASTTLNPEPIGASVVEPVQTRRVARPHSRLAKMGLVKAGDPTLAMHLSSHSDDTTPFTHEFQPLNGPSEGGSQAVHIEIHHDSSGKDANTSNVRKSDGQTKSHVESVPKLPLSTYASPDGPDQAPDPLKDFEKLAGMSQKWAELEAKLLSEGKPLTQEQLRWAKVFQKLQADKSRIKPDEDKIKSQAINDNGLQETNPERVEGEKGATKRKSQKKKAKKKRKHTSASGEHGDIGKEKLDTTEEDSAPFGVAASDEYRVTTHNWRQNSSVQKFVPATLPAPGGFLFPAPFAGAPQDEGPNLPREEALPKVFDPDSQKFPPRLVSFPPLPEDFVSAIEGNQGSKKVLGQTQCSAAMVNKPGSRARSQVVTTNSQIETLSPRSENTYRTNISPEEIIPSMAAAHNTSNSKTNAISQSTFVPPRQPRLTRAYLIERLTQEVSKVEVEKQYKSKMKQLIMVNKAPSLTTLKQHTVSFTRRYITDCLQHILDEYDGHSTLTDAVKNELAGIVRVASVLREKEVERFVDVFLNTHIWVDIKENNRSGATGGFSEAPKEETTWGLDKSASDSQEMKRLVLKGNIDYGGPSVEGVQMKVQRGTPSPCILPTKLEIMGDTVERSELGQDCTKSHAHTIVLHQQGLAPRMVHTQCTEKPEEQPSLLQPRWTTIGGRTVEKIPQMTKAFRVKGKERENNFPKLGRFE